MNVWFRTHAYHKCSWSIVWKYLRDALIDIGVEVYDDHANTPDSIEPCYEIWWGDPSKWEWSGRAQANIGIAIAEARSLKEDGRQKALENLRFIHMLICPSEWSAMAYRESPVEAPIMVVPFGIDDKEMVYIERDWSGTFRFLLAGAAQFRKGTWIGIEAFLKAFKNRHKAELLIWSSTKTPELEKLRKEYSKHSKIIFDGATPNSASEMYAKAHVLVSPHLSEGFGLMIPEALATGMPAIVARCSAPREYFGKDYGWWIEMSEIYAPVSDCLANTGGTWRLPDVDSLAERMWNAYKKRDECERRGLCGSKAMHENFKWQDTAINIVRFIKEVLDATDHGSDTRL